MKKQNRDPKKLLSKNTISKLAASLKEKSKTTSDSKIGFSSKRKRTFVKRRNLSDIFASLDGQSANTDGQCTGVVTVALPPKTDEKEPKRRRGRPIKSAGKQLQIKNTSNLSNEERVDHGVSPDQLRPRLPLPAKAPNYKGKEVVDYESDYGVDDGSVSSDDEYYLQDFDEPRYTLGTPARRIFSTTTLPLPKGGEGQLPPSSPAVADPSEPRLQECAESFYGKEFFMKREPAVIGLHTAMLVIAQNPQCHDAMRALMNATAHPPPGHQYYHQVPPQMWMPMAPALPPQMMAFGFSNFPGMYLVQGDPGSSTSGASKSGNGGNPAGAPPSGGV